MNTESAWNNAVLGPAAYSPEWYALRRWDPSRTPKIVFGASDAAVLCGMSAWNTPLGFWQQAMDNEIRDAEPESFRMRLGKAVESLILDEYRQITGLKVVAPVPMLHMAGRPHLVATPDAMAAESLESPGPEWIAVDAKSSALPSNWGDEYTDEVPVDVLFQAQQQMLVTGARIQHTAAWFRHLDTVRVFVVHRNDDLCQAIQDAADEMLQRLENGDPPEPTWTHPDEARVARSLYGVATMTPIELDNELAAKWQRQWELADEIKDKQAERDRLRAEVVLAMGEHGIARMAGYPKEIIRSWREPVDVAYTRQGYWDVRERKIGGGKRR